MRKVQEQVVKCQKSRGYTKMELEKYYIGKVGEVGYTEWTVKE